jgi:hypothetical protein
MPCATVVKMTSQDESAPAWAYEAVHIVDPDSGWPALADRYINELHGLLGSKLAGPFSMSARPPFPDLERSRSSICRLSRLSHGGWSMPASLHCRRCIGTSSRAT